MPEVLKPYHQEDFNQKCPDCGSTKTVVGEVIKKLISEGILPKEAEGTLLPMYGPYVQPLPSKFVPRYLQIQSLDAICADCKREYKVAVVYIIRDATQPAAKPNLFRPPFMKN
jgi:hypothetical protein